MGDLDKVEKILIVVLVVSLADHGTTIGCDTVEEYK